jgi:hypothetical protein
MAILVGAREDVNWANSAFRVIMAVRFLIRYLTRQRNASTYRTSLTWSALRWHYKFCLYFS